MAARQLSDGNSGGTTLGQSATDLISFYGATPVVKQTFTCVATGCAIAGTIVKFNTLVAALRTYGLNV